MIYIYMVCCVWYAWCFMCHVLCVCVDCVVCGVLCNVFICVSYILCILSSGIVCCAVRCCVVLSWVLCDMSCGGGGLVFVVLWFCVGLVFGVVCDLV